MCTPPRKATTSRCDQVRVVQKVAQKTPKNPIYPSLKQRSINTEFQPMSTTNGPKTLVTSSEDVLEDNSITTSATLYNTSIGSSTIDGHRIEVAQNISPGATDCEIEELDSSRTSQDDNGEESKPKIQYTPKCKVNKSRNNQATVAPSLLNKLIPPSQSNVLLKFPN